jgi:hypothetical protein
LAVLFSFFVERAMEESPMTGKGQIVGPGKIEAALGPETGDEGLLY